MEKIMPIVEELAQSYAYRRLESLVGLFEEGNLIPSIDEKIKTAFFVLRRKISQVLERLSGTNSSDADKMYFGRLVHKFLPAYPKFYKLDIYV